MNDWIKYEGPGLYLIIPYGEFIYYQEKDCPLCKSGASKEFKHGYYNRVKVPLGMEYKYNEHPEAPSVRPPKEGYYYTMEQIQSYIDQFFGKANELN